MCKQHNNKNIYDELVWKCMKVSRKCEKIVDEYWWNSRILGFLQDCCMYGMCISRVPLLRTYYLFCKYPIPSQPCYLDITIHFQDFFSVLEIGVYFQYCSLFSCTLIVFITFWNFFVYRVKVLPMWRVITRNLDFFKWWKRNGSSQLGM